MTASLLSTKLHIPSLRRETISRPHLISKLNAGLSGKLILISAPAGFGKTTLLTEWVTQCQFPVCWYSIDQYDNNLKRFISYVIESLESRNIRFEEVGEFSTQSNQNDSIETLWVPIINQIAHIDGQVALILDDYHLVQNQEIHQALTYLLEHLPSNMVLVIATRSDPPFRLAQLRAQADLCEIRAADLRFTVNETDSFLNQYWGLGLTSSDISSLTKKTEGWVVGLQLAAISLRKHPDKHSFVLDFAGNDRYIADYLLDEALHLQPGDIQNFLLGTSILEQFNASLCNAVLEWDDSQTTLQQLKQSNLFLVSLDTQQNWYRYHHLFQDLLRQRLRQVCSSEQVAEYHRRASAWYSSENFLVEAIQHAFEADEMGLMLSLIESDLVSLLGLGGLQTLIHWMASIPNKLKLDRPWVHVAHAWALLYAGNLSAGKDILHTAEHSISVLEKDEQARIKGYIAALRAYAAWIECNARNATQLAQQALAYLPEQDLSARAFASNTLGGALLQQFDIQAASEAFQNSYTWGQESGNDHVFIMAAGSSAYLALNQGQLRKAEHICLDVLAHLEKKKSQQLSPAVAQLYVMLANLSLGRKDLDRALKYAQESLEISKKWKQLDTLTLSYSFLVGVLIARHDFEQAKFVLAEAQSQCAHISDWFRIILDETEAQLNLESGNIKAALQWADKNGMDYQDELPETEPFFYKTLAQILMADGKFPEAALLLEKLITYAENVGTTGHLFSLFPMQSVVQYHLGNQEQALHFLEKALELAELEEYTRAFIDLGEPMAKLLYQATIAGIYPEFCNRLLAEMEVSAKPAPHPTESLVEPLSKREIEILECIAKGCSNQEIAQELVLSLYTVKSHARNIYSKLGVKNRTEAVAKARLLGLLSKD